MNGEELRPFEVRTGHRGYHLGDGYDWMEAIRASGWRPLASWGDVGYDLGDWPYICFAVRGPRVQAEHDGEPGPFELVEHVEGDLRYWSFPTGALRRAAISYLFVWYATHSIGSRPYAAGWNPEDPATWPAGLEGPYRYLAREEAVS